MHRIRPATGAVVVALLLVTAGCLGATGGETDDEPADIEDLPDADDLLEATLESQSAVETVQGTQTVTIEDGEETVTTTQEVWQRAPDQYRAEIIETDEPEQFDVTVTDGNTTWMYDETENVAVRATFEFDDADQEAFEQGVLEMFSQGMEPSVTGTETVADREAYVLELTPVGEDATYESATVWVDRETSYPLRQETTMAIGDEEMTTFVGFEEVTIDEPIEDEIFEFEPPEDAEIRDADDFTFEQYGSVAEAEDAVPFELPEPTVPGGYALETVVVSENLAGWGATLQYADDQGSLLTVTVAEETQEPVVEPDSEPVDVDGVDATIRSITADERAIEWEADGLSYTVSGDLEDDELLAVAESIVG